MEFVDNDQIRSILFEISKKIILPNFRNLNSDQINYKNNKDIVTSVDIEVENYLKKTLPQFLKNSQFFFKLQIFCLTNLIFLGFPKRVKMIDKSCDTKFRNISSSNVPNLFHTKFTYTIFSLFEISIIFFSLLYISVLEIIITEG